MGVLYSCAEGYRNGGEEMTERIEPSERRGMMLYMLNGNWQRLSRRFVDIKIVNARLRR